MILTIMRLEIHKLLRYPLMWGILALTMSVIAFLFHQLCLDYIHLAQNSLQQRQALINFTQNVIRPWCSWTIIVLAIIIPIFSTLSFSQEFRQGSFLLWATSPVKACAMVMGKFLGNMMIILAIVMYMLFIISTLCMETSLNWPMILTSLLTVVCVSSCLMSFSLCISCLLTNPLLAIGLSFLGNLFWMLLEWLNPLAHLGFSLKSFGLLSHSYHLLNGVIYSPDLIYYGLFIGGWLILTQQIIRFKLCHA